MADVKELNINSTTYDIKAKSVVDNNSGAVKFWTGTKAQYTAIVSKDSKTQYTCTDTGEMFLGNIQISASSSSRNIGEVVTSTIPLTDAGLHLLDGALIQGDGIYSAFVNYIADLYDSGDYTAIFDTEANWQTAVTTYGVCGKFVYDSVNNTVRLPKWGNQIVTTLPQTLGVKGNGLSLGVTDGTNNYGLYNIYAGGITGIQTATGSYDVAVGSSPTGLVTSTSTLGVTTNSSKSGIVAETSNIKSSEVYYYIVIATTTKTDIQVDIDEIATDLNGKADVDLTNVNNSGTSRGASWAMPSSSVYDELTLGASGSTYTAPADGYFILTGLPSVATTNYIVLESSLMYSATGNMAIGYSLDRFIPVKKGETITVNYNNFTVSSFRFIYAVGSEWEAQ